MSIPSHVQFRLHDRAIVCERCGERYPVVLPMEPDALQARLTAFAREHRHRKPTPSRDLFHPGARA